MPAIAKLLNKTMLLTMVASALAENLVINVGTQAGSFLTGDDVGELNAHDYRPGEFVTNDFIYEGLTEWDSDLPNGVDNIPGNEDDYVKPSLATSWTTNYNGTRFEIVFQLRTGVTFHDGQPWNAAACKINFDHIVGGDGVGPPPNYGTGTKSGWAFHALHDWMGFTQQIYGWEAVGDMQFKLILSTYYEAVFRELAVIRPFRMMSPLVLPSIADRRLSHNRFRCEGPRPRTDADCFPRPFPVGCLADQGECYTPSGITAPIGTGPYMVVSKTLSNGRVVPAADFNATCFFADTSSNAPYFEECRYETGATVSEVLFTKFAGHRKQPTYDNVILKSYDNKDDVKVALQQGSLDIAYGVQALSPAAFISLATAEEGAKLFAHKAPRDINTRLLVLNSNGALNTTDLRKRVMGILAANRQNLYDGELAEEEPMDTLFDPTAPHCAILNTLSSINALTTQTATEQATLLAELQAKLAARQARTGNAEDGKLRFMYKPSIPHEAIIASHVISELTIAGISVHPMPVDKDGYNSNNCDYMQPIYSYNDNGADLVAGTADDHECDVNFAVKGFASAQECFSSYHAWDIAYSETWAAPYDPTAKLWDMTHGHEGGWCSQESDAPAVTNMETMVLDDFRTKVRSLSTTVDPTARQDLYNEVLTTLHNEAIFLPLTAKRQTAVTNERVSGFEFGDMEFDMPLANLKPTVYPSPSPPPDAPSAPPPPTEKNDLPGWGIALVTVASLAFLSVAAFVSYMYNRERQGKPIFKPFLAKVEKDGSAP